MTLEGPRIRLQPLTRAHHVALSRIGLDEQLWQATTIRVDTADDMAAYIDAALEAQAAGTARPFVIVLRETGHVVGTTRFHSMAPQHRRFEIGFTWVASPWQRQGIAREAKAVMLAYAFETAGCERVEFRADVDNQASIAALRELGATEEGVLRRYMQSEHRGARDVAIFSIIAPEWPAVRARLNDVLHVRPEASS